MAIEDSLERTLHRTARNEETHLPESSRGIHATAALRGLQAGFVATLITTAFRLPIMRSLPPSANFWSTYVGSGEPEEYPVIGLLLHLLYGTVNGAVFGALFALQSAERSVEPEGRGIV